MKKLFILPAILILTGVLSARVNAQSKVFIAPMQNNFNDFIATAFIKNKVPVILTTKDEQADFIVTGGSSIDKDKWYNVAFEQDRSKNSSPIKVLRQSDKSIVWSGSKSDKSFWGVIKNGIPDFWQAMKEIPQDEQEKIANKFARQVKKDIFNSKDK
jgi:hypothetical protein